MDRLHRRPPDLDGYAETELGRTTAKQGRKQKIALYGANLVSLVVVAWAVLYSNPDPSALPWWWWPLLVLGWQLLAILLSAAIAMLLFHGATWRCTACDAKLEERHTTDVSPKLGELNATIFVCHQCRKFQAYLSTQGSSD